MLKQKLNGCENLDFTVYKYWYHERNHSKVSLLLTK